MPSFRNNTDAPVRARAIRVSAIDTWLRAQPGNDDGPLYAIRVIVDPIPHDATLLGCWSEGHTLRPDAVLVYSHPSWEETGPGGAIPWIVPTYQQLTHSPVYPGRAEEHP